MYPDKVDFLTVCVSIVYFSLVSCWTCCTSHEIRRIIMNSAKKYIVKSRVFVSYGGIFTSDIKPNNRDATAEEVFLFNIHHYVCFFAK